VEEADETVYWLELLEGSVNRQFICFWKPLMSTLIQDLRYALRVLARSPGFTAVVIITLALGIGANTAMFSVVYGVLLKPLPYPHAERIVQISRTYRGRQEANTGFTATAFDFWKEHSKPFAFLAAATGEGVNLTGAGQAEHVDALRVSTGYFQVFGVKPLIGRTFNSEEESFGGPAVAVLSYFVWREHFGGDPAALGRTILLDGVPYSVIGVMPAGFDPAGDQTAPVALWTTIGQVRNTVGSGQNYEVIGRLRTRVSRLQADAYLAGVAHAFAEQNYKRASEQERLAVSFVAEPYLQVITRSAPPLLVLFGAIGFVLLIACVNVANLLLVRTAARSREIALRTAFGASRRRIVRQLLTESVLMSVSGAALGIVVAFWGLRTLLALAPDILPRAQNVAINGWALLFTAGVGVLTGILFGLAPALQASQTQLNESLKEGETRASLSPGRHRLTSTMVSSEVAFSMLLLIGSGLLMRAFVKLLNTSAGFNPHNMLVLEIWTAGSRYDSMPKLARFYQDQIVKRLEAIPGVQSAAVVAAGTPFSFGGNDNPGVRVNGKIETPSVDYREITPAYFRTLGVPIVMGSAFSASDTAGSAKVTIINLAFARQYFHGENPVGHHLLYPGPVEIVGVAGDVKSLLDEPSPPTFFIPMAQADYKTDRLFQGWVPTSVLVRTSVEPLSLSHAVTSAVRGTDPSMAVGHIETMDQALSVSLSSKRFLMMLMTVFAGLALILAAVGIYGVLSYSVRRRTHEIGIRMALGAERRDALRLIVKEGMWLTLIGIAVGAIGLLPLTSLVVNYLYGVRPTDPLTYAAVGLALAVVGFFASYIPARRATKVDPVVALRYE
jgi:putative ABC transport system permease protein